MNHRPTTRPPNGPALPGDPEETARAPLSATLAQAELEAWGRSVGSAAAGGGLPLPLVLALRGRLGAGKSVLARAIARGAGVTEPMPSPTYNLRFGYRPDAGPEVQHLDLYRLEHPDDVWELGWQELAEGEQVVLIEWPERAETLLPPDRWDITLELVPGEDGSGLRTLRVEPLGAAPAPPPIREAS